jgi:hypothetical protein
VVNNAFPDWPSGVAGARFNAAGKRTLTLLLRLVAKSPLPLLWVEASAGQSGIPPSSDVARDWESRRVSTLLIPSAEKTDRCFLLPRQASAPALRRWRRLPKLRRRSWSYPWSHLKSWSPGTAPFFAPHCVDRQTQQLLLQRRQSAPPRSPRGRAGYSPSRLSNSASG